MSATAATAITTATTATAVAEDAAAGNAIVTVAEDMIVATTGRNAGRAIMTVARRPTATVTASCARLVPSGITAIRAMTFTVAVDGVPMKVARL